MVEVRQQYLFSHPILGMSGKVIWPQNNQYGIGRRLSRTRRKIGSSEISKRNDLVNPYIGEYL